MKGKQLLSVLAGAFGLTLILITIMHPTVLYAGAALPAEQVTQGGTIPTTVVLTPTKDNTLYESATGNLSNGAGAYFFAGKTAGGNIRRGLVAFAVADQVPTGATIVSATLQLRMSKTAGGAAAITLHRALGDWGEGASNADLNEGSGVTATAGDATWLHTFYDTATWQTPGGDFVPTATATVAVSSITSYQWTSPALVADVQQWLDNPNSNFGWLILGDESAARTAKRFDASENPTPASRPQLTIIYTVATTETMAVYLPLIQKE